MSALKKPKIDTLSFIMEVESDGFDPERQDHIDALQEMISTGLVWKLQGFWGRFATEMIRSGIVNSP